MVSTENRIRKVLITADTVGGVWTYCIDLINELSKKEIHFHLVTAGAPLSKEQRRQVDQLYNTTLYETEFRLEWMHNPWNDIDFSGMHLLELERKLKPDIVHLNSYSYAALPFKAPVMVVAHSDVFSWWFSVKKSLPGAEWQEYFRRVKDGIRRADCIVAPSDAMMNMLNAIYGPPKDQRIIHNGRSAANFGCDRKLPRVMCAGRLWDEAKNLKLLTRAAEDINAEIHVAGDLAAQQQFRPARNIRFLGKLDSGQMAEELAASLIYAAPARYEPFGLSILEAALSGCALVLGNVHSLREIWQDSAVYVDVDDDWALATACNRFLQDRKLAEEFGKKAMKRAKVFSLQRMGLRYTKLYNELAGKKLELETMQIM